MVWCKGKRTSMWVVLAVLVVGPLLQLVLGGVGQFATFRFWFALFGWLALGLILAYPVYLFVSNDEDAVDAMLRAGAAPAAPEMPVPAAAEAAAPPAQR